MGSEMCIRDSYYTWAMRAEPFLSFFLSYRRLLCPPGLVAHLLLDLVDPLERVHGLVQQERRVVHQHVHKLDKVIAAGSAGGKRKREREKKVRSVRSSILI